jgi:competence protein ComEC
VAFGLRFEGPPVGGYTAGILLALTAIPFLSRRGKARPVGGGVPAVHAAVGASLFAGALLGSSAADRSAAACVQDLSTGAGVRVRGVAREEAPPGRSGRLTLEAVRLREVATGRSCSIPRLIVRVDRVPRRVSTGSEVFVRGEWVRIDRPSDWPHRPGRVGITVGRVTERDVGARSPLRDRRWLGRELRALRGRMSGRLRERLPPDVGPVARALVLAERDDLPGALRARFADAGLAHLLAISGLHVGMIGAFVVLLLRPLAGPVRASIGAAVIVALYVAAIGAPPSAVRAALLLVGWAAARGRGRPARPWDLLGGAAILALVVDPIVLVEPGFQLSFAGFAGLGAGGSLFFTVRGRCQDRSPAIAGTMHRLSRGTRRRLSLLGLATVSGAGAFLATAPIAAAHFQHVAPAALVSHFVGAPLAGAAIGSICMALLLPPPLSDLGAAAATTVIRLMTASADWIAALPGAHADVAAPSGWTWAAVLAVLVALWNFLRWGRVRRTAVPLCAALAIVWAAPALRTAVFAGRSLLCTLDVGQGDAAALRTAAGRWILFDAGPRFGERDAGRDVVLPLLRKYGARRVDLFVLSHPDLDHLGGFSSIHDGVPVLRILDSGHPIPSPAYARFLARTEEDGVRWLPGRAGDRVRLDNVTIRVLGPAASDGRERTAAGANETSLLLRVSIGRALVYLNTGDATARDELSLLAAWGPDSLRADLLKVGHHGSRSSSSSAFLAAVRPRTAVISAGRGNAYGHPHAAVLERLSRTGVPRVWRTDREGTLCVEADDQRGWRVRGEDAWTLPAGRGTRLDVTKGG